MSAYGRMASPVQLNIGRYYRIIEGQTTPRWRVEAMVTFNDLRIESVVQFNILKEGLGVPLEYHGFVKNPLTSQNQEDSLTNKFAFAIQNKDSDRIVHHDVTWHQIKTSTTSDWEMGLDMMQAMNLVLTKAYDKESEFIYRFGF